MKLDLECIRSILIWIEENQVMKKKGNKDDGSFTGKPKKIISKDIIESGKLDYSEEDILYSLLQMNESGLIKADWVKNDIGPNYYKIRDITPEGHDFLGNIRSNDNWDKTKSAASKVGATTLKAMVDIAGKVVSGIIKQVVTGG
ncbi:MAG: DUF2513 domain-containing protein [Defluviitaleaceae bacterium]|nr:DUF2513 domain-containing protein [Defluviitaleaceae bacterium]